MNSGIPPYIRIFLPWGNPTVRRIYWTIRPPGPWFARMSGTTSGNSGGIRERENAPSPDGHEVVIYL